MKLIKSVKTFVDAHPVVTTMIATATVCAVISRQALKEHNNFLKDHDLYDAFYTPKGK